MRSARASAAAAVSAEHFANRAQQSATRSHTRKMATAEELLEAIRDQGDRGIALITEMQAVAAAQREANRIAIERLGAAQGASDQCG